MTQIPAYKFWNTWSTKSPAAMCFLPSDFIINIGAYSNSSQKYTTFPFSDNIRLFEHHPDGRYCRLEAEHSGTVLGIEYIKPNPWTVAGRIKVLKSGEWGFRFWVLLSFGFRGNNGTMRLCDGEARGNYRSYCFAVKSAQRPSRSVMVDDVDAAGRDMEENGYYVPERSVQNGRWALYKYNFEETPEIYFTVGVANSEDEALQNADSAISLYDDFDNYKKEIMKDLPEQKGELSCSAEAIRDVMAWNSIEDEKNRRVFTTLTRCWIGKNFGGWLVWKDDVLYHALINAWSGDWSMARENLKTVLYYVMPQGNIACMMSEYTESVDHTQPPIEAFVAWKYYQITGDLQFLELYYPILKTAYNWWFENRDGNGNGVLELGSSCNGSGFSVGTKLAAKGETAMENSPMYDKAEYVPQTHTVNLEDIGVNSLLALDGEILAMIAKELGKTDESDEIQQSNEKFKKRIDNALWDKNREIYANKLWTDEFTPCSPTSFYPLAAGIPDLNRADKLVGHMFDKNEFWSYAPLPSISLKEESVNDNCYWRGRMWAPLNFLSHVGLKRYHKDEEAYRLARRSMEIFSARWKEERACYENYNTFTGLGGDSVDADKFYGWGALIPLMWICEHIDIDPWNGFHFGDIMGEHFEIDGLKIKGGKYRLECKDGKTRLYKNGLLIFESDAAGRFRHFHYGCHYACVEIDSQSKPCKASFPSCTPVRTAINGEEKSSSNTFDLPLKQAIKLELWY
jgi:putative isomerase